MSAEAEIDAALADLDRVILASERRLGRAIIFDQVEGLVDPSSPAGDVAGEGRRCSSPSVSSLDWRAGEPLGSRRVLFETWRPITFGRERVTIGAPRSGPARSDQLFPPITLRITDPQFADLVAAVLAAREV